MESSNYKNLVLIIIALFISGMAFAQPNPGHFWSQISCSGCITSSNILDGTINYVDINASSVQRRVSSTCAPGSSIRIIGSDGSVTCETDDIGVSGWTDEGTVVRLTTITDSVGIGTSTPGTYRLYVNSGNVYVGGDIALSGTVDGYDISSYGQYFINSAGTSGQVWTSDGSGRGVWAAAPGGVGGSGTDNYIPRWSGTGALENSVIYQTDTGFVGIGTSTPGTYRLYVNSGNVYVGGDIALSGTVDGYDISSYGQYFINSAGTSGQVWTSDGSGRGVWAAFSKVKAYDSGWFAISNDGKYVLNHGLGTTNVIMQILLADNAAGNNPWPAANDFSVAMYYVHANLITTTNIQIITGQGGWKHPCVCGTKDSFCPTANPLCEAAATSGYCRVLMWALE